MRLQTTCPRCETWVETEMDEDGDAVCPACENTFHSDYFDTPQKRIFELETQLTKAQSLIERLFETGHMMIGDATDWWDGEAVEKWNALIAEYRAIKAKEMN